MSAYTFTPKSFELLAGLAENNDKAWYADHKKDFEHSLRHPFARVLELARDRKSTRLNSSHLVISYAVFCLKKKKKKKKHKKKKKKKKKRKKKKNKKNMR